MRRKRSHVFNYDTRKIEQGEFRIPCQTRNSPICDWLDLSLPLLGIYLCSRNRLFF